MMGQPSAIGGKVCFGPFELDFVSGELRKFGIRIRLQPQPFNVLVALIERPGEVVSKEVLHQRIWGAETAVDFEHGLGTAVNKVREALGDSADSPRYIETVPKRGYRFLAPVQPSQAAPAPVIATPGASPQFGGAYVPSTPARSSEQRRVPGRSSWRWALAAALVLSVAAAAVFFLRPDQAVPGPGPRVSQITWSDSIYPGELSLERLPGVGTDGLRIYFPEIRGGRVLVAQASPTDGEVRPLITAAEIARPALADISPDGASLLVRSMVWSKSEMEQPLWIVPSAGGVARKLPGVLAHDAAWLPDGRSIAYAAGRDLWITRNDGGPPRKLAALPGRAFWIRYAPDGSRLRFTLLDPTTRAATLWELSADGRNLRPLLPHWNDPPAECCGSWTPDGKYFFFQSTRNGISDIWMRTESRGGLWPGSPGLTRLTTGPLSYVAPTPARRGSRLFVIGSHARSQLFRFDAASGQFVRFLPQISTAGRTEFSPDGDRIAWISTSDSSLWQGKPDGTDRLQLTTPPTQVYMARWSPDGRQLAYMGRRLGESWRIYLTPREGGVAERLLDEPLNQADPCWSADGRSLAFGRPPDYMGDNETPKAIYLVDLKTRTLSTLPGSAGLFSPRWSPDGRHIAAMSLDQRRLLLFDSATRKWSELVSRSVHNPVWSRNGEHIYFNAFMEEDAPILRLTVSSRRVERIADAMSVQPAALRYWGLTPDDAPIVSLLSPAGDIYALDWGPAGHQY